MHTSRSSIEAALAHLLSGLIRWELWKARNKAAYEDIITPPGQIARQVLELLHHINAAHPFTTSSPKDDIWLQLGLLPFTRRPAPTMCITLVWTLPPYPYAKLNVDGSSLGNLDYSGGGALLGTMPGTNGGLSHPFMAIT